MVFDLHAPVLEAGWVGRYLRSESPYKLGLKALDSVLGRVLTSAGMEEVADVRASERLWLERRKEELLEDDEEIDAEFLEQFPFLKKPSL